MMKSSDVRKVNRILSEIVNLNYRINTFESFESNKLCAEISCENNCHFRFDQDFSKEIFDVIIQKLNSEKEEYIKKLAELGVEYVDETA